MEIALVVGLLAIGAVGGALITVAFVIDPPDWLLHLRDRAMHDETETQIGEIK